jgi:16S rRNA (adenine1518-N6/adenine1519-N6)-dimethyltransferase
MKHRARKRFGQNFLHDNELIGRIVDAINPSIQGNLIEIGPGQGALTFPLLDACQQMTVIELDRDLVQFLETSVYGEQLTILSQDVLTVDFKQFDGELRIVGNLPYNISTPIMMHLLKSEVAIKDMHFMLQKEVIDRLAAESGSKQYGRLSIVTQYCCDVYPLFEVPPESFNPAPKVMSGIVRLVPKKLTLVERELLNSLQELAKKAFATRRKTLRNNLKGTLTDTDFEALGINPTNRAEQLSVDEYVNIAKYLSRAD